MTPSTRTKKTRTMTTSTIDPTIDTRMETAVTIALEPPRQEQVIALLEQSDAYLMGLYPPESNHLMDVASLESPGIAFFVARSDGNAIGCCAMVPAGDGTAEIKRMFVAAQARGLRLGRQLLEQLERHARTCGMRALRLETGIRQPEALGLYRSSGYLDIGPFGSYLPDPLSLFMEKRLDQATAPTAHVPGTA
jgi:putative acetyltransferase